MALLALYWGIMIACYAVASKLRAKADRFAFVEEFLNIVIYILVLIMGLRMGANREVTSNLDVIGLQAVGVTIFAVGGSILFVFGARKLLGLNRQGIRSDVTDEEKSGGCGTQEEESAGGMKTTLIILAFVLAGMLLGYFVIPEIFEDTDRFQEMSGDWLVAGICLLLGTVGFNLGLSGGIFEKFKGMGVSVIIIPVAAVAGSLICGTLYSFLSPMTMRECIAVSAGFGWYTMAPSVITEAGFAVAGAVSFMHNVIRETLGIVIIPLAAKKIGYLEAISIPGVAAMDVCLPIIEKSCRTETIVYSMCTGALMCVTVPIAVPLANG